MQPPSPESGAFIARCPRAGTRFEFESKPVRLSTGWRHKWCRACRRSHRESALICARNRYRTWARRRRRVPAERSVEHWGPLNERG
eukprot:12645879-Alexandrium_andersonii.AAC.1